MGKEGERFAYNVFSSTFSDMEVTWVNERAETGQPYDILLGAEGNRLLHIDVKATSIVNKDWFFISKNEYQFAVENDNAFSFAHIRLSEGGLPRITMFRDPAKLVKSRRLKLALHIPKAEGKNMQFDDENRVEIQQTEARNRVEMFRHLPQYERANQLSDLESKFFQLDHVHPAVYEVGLRFLAGDIMLSTTRCIAMLQAFKKVIEDYLTPSEKTLSRDLTVKINSSVSFLIECRPLSIGMGNAIRVLKALIQKSTLAQTDSEAKAFLCSAIDRYINEKIILADKVIIRHAVTKIRDGDVLLTYGCSSLIEAILLHAYELRRQFQVVIVDSRPNLEGQSMLRRLIEKGLSCTYTHINGVSYIMHEVTKVFLGAASVFSNGTIYSTVGTACIAMVADAYHVPVLVCCESFKFHERVQLDAICSNELGDPDVIAKVPGRMNSCLDDWASKENLQLLNLAYDVTPADYVSMIVTEHGMIPPTSVPVIVREYCRDHILI
nr:initiation factor 2B-related protein [Tanacetum cinerariifolium]